MTKRGPVFIGFILAVMVKSFFAHYEFVGLLIVGFIVGYMCHDGFLSGMWNAAVAGALGTIISAILFVLCVTFGGFLFGIFGGLTGFTLSGLTSITIVLGYLVYYAIVMGIAGGVGGILASKK